MKKELNPAVAAVVVIVLVIIAGIFIYRGASGGAGNVAPGQTGHAGPFAPGGVANSKMAAPPARNGGAPGTPR